MVRNLFFVCTLFAERFAHLFQCSAVGFVCFAHRKDETEPDIADAIFAEKIAHGSTLGPVAEKILMTYYEMDAASEMTAFENQAS